MKKRVTFSILAVLFWLFLVACGVPTSPTNLPVTAPATGVDYDRDGIYDNIEEELAQRFAPVVKLHPDDNYRPANIGLLRE